MLTMPGRSGHRVLALFSVLLLSACSARPVLHEFPPPLAPDARPEAAVSYTLRQLEPDSDKWILRGAAGEQVGEFRWKPAFREVVETASPDRSEDFRRNDLIQDGVNHTDYIFRVSATSGSLSRSSSLGTAPPRATIFAAATGQRVGELEIRGGYDMRFEGDWNGRQILW
ncbi:MAG TPA: hypothetical protein VF267_12870, partial [Gammaproteobacteria bacterium]